MKRTFPYEQFNSPMHQAWKKDRLRRQRVSLAEAWRGCIGFAMLWRNVDHAECHGQKLFYTNENLSWLCLRDVPPGHFPGSISMNRRMVMYASKTQAVLHHGMPALDFAAPTHLAWDFSFLPFETAKVLMNGRQKAWMAGGDILNSAERPREFAVLTQLSAAMTRFAASVRDDRKRPVRPAWYRVLRGRRNPMPVVPAHDWFPKPYLGFQFSDIDRLYGLATQSQPASSVFRCSECGGAVESTRLRTTATFLEDGDFTATCPQCRIRCRWNLDDSTERKASRYFGHSFRADFCAAVARKLPLTATKKVRYLGVRHTHGAQSGPDLLTHVFTAVADGKQLEIHLPRSTCILVRPNEIVAAGDVWCTVLPETLPDRSRRALSDQWSSLAEVIGQSQLVGWLQQVWFHNQAVRLIRRPELVYYPAHLVANAVRDVIPQDLIWDVQDCEHYVDPQSEAAIFPPKRQRRWDQLRMGITDVDINAGISDPRFTGSIQEPQCLSSARPIVECA